MTFKVPRHNLEVDTHLEKINVKKWADQAALCLV